MIEGVLYALTELLLQGVVASIAHGPTMLHDPLLESSECPADAALGDSKVENGSTVDRVQLCVVYQFECNGPGHGTATRASLHSLRIACSTAFWCWIKV